MIGSDTAYPGFKRNHWPAPDRLAFFALQLLVLAIFLLFLMYVPPALNRSELDVACTEFRKNAVQSPLANQLCVPDGSLNYLTQSYTSLWRSLVVAVLIIACQTSLVQTHLFNLFKQHVFEQYLSPFMSTRD